VNLEVLFLFANAVLTTVLSAVIVLWILRKQYLPVIRRLEEEERGADYSDSKPPEREG
jgi:flagellar biosynthesis/type III secretory pathway M-ring protein FliF/YscJ